MGRFWAAWGLLPNTSMSVAHRCSRTVACPVTGLLGDPSLFTLVIKFGGPAIVIVYCQNKYLKE
jgi:hypothetical protein